MVTMPPRSAIIGLLFTGAPLAILRRIRAIVIDAFDSQSFRRQTHIVKKGFKTITPAVAHNDTSSAVIGIRRIILVVTSAYQMSPSVIKTCTALSMSASCIAKHFFSQTTAAFSAAFTKPVATHHFLIPAIAETQPSGFATYSSLFLENDQLFESLTSKIDEIIVRHNHLRRDCSVDLMRQPARSTGVRVYSPSRDSIIYKKASRVN